ncbi:MAG: CDC48 family AAA ATPase [Candidatus Aenigmarchaeota archaeon]|nr:CDC48 family AAA ATPase [Candidatus Aenigmarchaeota archaeon]
MEENNLALKVGELTSRDEFGRGIVRIDAKTMQKLSVREGDIVELEGKRKTGALVVRAYPADVGLNVVRMDGITRSNAGIGVGESIKVAKAEAPIAKRVLLAPIQKGVVIQMNPDLLKKNLYMRPVTKKDIITPFPVVKQRRSGSPFEDFFGMNLEDIFFTPIPGETKLIVASSNPEGIVRIGDQTVLELSPEAVDLEERAIPNITYEDIGGLQPAIEKIREMVELPLRHPELFLKLGIDPPKGVLLYGPPGTGKTLLAKAVANESGAYFVSVSGPEFVSKFYGQSEQNLRKIFKEAEKNAPSIIFIDEIDSIAPKREDVTGEVERRIVSQMLTLMDGLKSRGKVVVIAATNRENAIDQALRRGGRFDREIEIGVPDQKGRKQVLQIHTRNMPLAGDVDLAQLASITYGFVGADLETLCKEAAMSALRRVLPGLSWKKEKELPPEIFEKLQVTKQDFNNALKMVEPSAMREVLIEVPNIRWSDVGGLEEVKQRLKEVVEWPLKKPEAFKRMGIRPAKGILLYGPPGTGKTMLAKAVAKESEANFISIRGPEVLNKFVGESEKRIRDIFRRAKQVAPSIIFFDEIDAIAPRRGMDMGNRVTENVVSMILTEMSGLEELHNVIIMAGTNRPDILDSALLRPGRFDRHVLVPAPMEKEREEILKIHTKKMPLGKDVDLKKLAKATDGFSGADLEALAREAGFFALRESFESKIVSKKHFDNALKRAAPSISKEMKEFYDKLSKSMKRPIKKENKEEIGYVG